jgi:hypothetical protein
MSHTYRRWFWALALTAVLALGGCGGGTTSPDGSGTGTTVPTTAP